MKQQNTLTKPKYKIGDSVIVKIESFVDILVKAKLKNTNTPSTSSLYLVEIIGASWHKNEWHYAVKNNFFHKNSSDTISSNELIFKEKEIININDPYKILDKKSIKKEYCKALRKQGINKSTIDYLANN